ncbi:hypothetical protein FE257_002088 [Aspergillus nanangensis]|uniref:Zn(2)-C6 fungal-type domain-containing protein n=1 Tax=Aspergillus nanangensis TaxID=2582783 RepID=A0AAD4CTK8_ASPNN|nr:hypothetical protein FE257_002088 [Aspergillus nanangensis]
MPDSPCRSIENVQSPANERSPKRRRVALACACCRERKVRCDGVKPVCGACERRGNTAEQCEYLVIADTAKYQTERAYIQSLRDHIASLGGSVQPQTSSTIPIHHDANADEAPRAVRISPIIHTGLPSGSIMEKSTVSRSHQDTCDHHDSPASASLPGTISAMGATLTDLDDSTMRDEYYGQSSIISLVQECAQTSPGQQSLHSQPRRTQHPVTPSASSTSSCNVSCSAVGMSSLLSDDFSLPPRRTADWLLEIYFTNAHLFYPWVHKDSFLVSYNFMWSNKDSSALNDLPDVGLGGRNCAIPVFYCALNAILATACEFSNMPSKEKRTSSLMFYERMKSLINIDIIDSGSLAHVQALLLVAIYLQCTPYPRRCWNIVGMAYRMAVGLGLHLSRKSTKLSGLEKEMRWRAWCACVQMDIIVSMTMGRPAMTSAPSKVPLPSPTDDQYLGMGPHGATQPVGIVSANQFLHENMKLIGILGNILSAVYHSTEPGSEVEIQRPPDVDFQAVMDIDKSLTQFESDLHPALHWDPQRVPTSNINPIFGRQANVLHARYLHLKLLLNRPAFSHYCSMLNTETQPNTPSSARSWTALCRANCAMMCVQSACDLVDSLAKATSQDATGAWWYGVFYLISAGIILISADVSGASFDAIDGRRREAAWGQCLDTLYRMVDVHPSARDYAIALNGLKERHLAPSSARVDPNDGQATTAFLEARGRNEGTNSVAGTEDESNQSPGMGGNTEPSYDVLSPFLSNWESGLEDIMLPAHLLQDMDEGLLLPNLF